MKKVSSHFVCQNCGYESVKWLGLCPQCENFGTLVEELIEKEPPKKARRRSERSEALPIAQVGRAKLQRLASGIEEFDRVLGGGVVPGSTVLLGGEPGVGKSTLLLQALYALASPESSVLYVTGEESLEQIGMRAERVGVGHDSVWVLAETDVTAVCEELERLQPTAAVIDSIQTMHHPQLNSSTGSVSQIRESAAALIRVAKAKGIPLFFVGHVTKEGIIAGPRVLEHMVDTVLYLEGEAHYALRVLRATKNRFGPTGEVGVFRLTEEGLEPVSNPSEYLLSQGGEAVSGTCIGVVAEGKRPLLVEVQALVVPTYFGTPRRVVTGADYNRVAVIIAVLERRAGCRLSDKDIYVNVVGGIRVVEPAADLPIALAIASSRFDKPIPRNYAAFGELGLGGEVRPVSLADRRLQEAGRLGLQVCLGPVYDELRLKRGGGAQLGEVRNIDEAIRKLWGKSGRELERAQREQRLRARRAEKETAEETSLFE